MGDHSLIGASSLSRVIACPASLRASLDAIRAGTERGPTIYSAQGTVAHGVADQALRQGADLALWRGRTQRVDGFTIDVDAGMLVSVGLYVDTVRNLAASAEWHQFETRVVLDRYWEPDETPPPMSCFGTADCLIYHRAAQHLDVIDYKHGAGVFVAAEDNPQLLFYAAGALLAVPGPVRTITQWIVQPRIAKFDKIRTVEITALDVLVWVEDTLKPAVVRAVAPDAVFVPGRHCRFCPASPTCEARIAHRQQQAILAFA